MTAATVLLLALNTPAGPDDDQISPGLAGFLTVFLLALATWLLMRSMVKHLRKVRYGPGPQGAALPGDQGRDRPAGSDGGQPAGSDARPDGQDVSQPAGSEDA